MSETASHKTAAELMVECLENEGLEFVIGVPGEENLDFLSALRRSKKIRFVLTRHEQSATFMAATIGRLTGKPAAALSTLGPGATNLVTGVAYAQLGGFPLICLTGQKGVRASKQGSFQVLNIVDMMRPLTKFTRQIVSAARVPSLVREAARLSQEERPGAVHLELPEDIATEPAPAQLSPIAVSAVRRPVAEDKAITAAVAALRACKTPLLFICAGANRKRTANMLTRFVDELGVPFCDTQMGKGVVSEDHPLFLGTAALSANDLVHSAIALSDCIVAVGHDTVEKPPFFSNARQTLIHVNFFSAQVDDVYHPQIEVVGDVGNAVWQLLEALRPPHPRPAWDLTPLSTLKSRIDRLLFPAAHPSDVTTDATFPVPPSRVVSILRARMPDDGIVALDNGIYKIWFARQYRARAPHTLLLDNALATMGAGFPSAIGARLVHPEFEKRKVVAVCGDGGFMMSGVAELETAVRLGVDVTVVILNDEAYGMIIWKNGGAEEPGWGLKFRNPDFVKLAESFGCVGHRPRSAAEFDVVMQRCLSSKGVHVVDLAVDYSENASLTAAQLGHLTESLEVVCDEAI